MKLHLPSSLRKALLACLAAIAAHALPVTVSTGTLAASGALISFLAAQQALADGEDEDDDTTPLTGEVTINSTESMGNAYKEHNTSDDTWVIEGEWTDGCYFYGKDENDQAVWFLTINANVVFNTDLVINNGSSQGAKTQTFNGAISGTGNLVWNWTSGNTLVFNGDMSAWSGDIGSGTYDEQSGKYSGGNTDFGVSINGVTSNSGKIHLRGSNETLTLTNAELQNSDIDVANLALSGTSSFTNATGTMTVGNISGGSLSFGGASFTVNGSGTMDVLTFTNADAAFILNGTLALNKLAYSGDGFTVAAGEDGSGVLELKGNGNNPTYQGLTIAEGITFRMNDERASGTKWTTFDSLTINGILDLVAGELCVQGTTSIAAITTGTGDFTVLSGTTTILSSADISGRFQVRSGTLALGDNVILTLGYNSDSYLNGTITFGTGAGLSLVGNLLVGADMANFANARITRSATVGDEDIFLLRSNTGDVKWSDWLAGLAGMDEDEHLGIGKGGTGTLTLWDGDGNKNSSRANATISRAFHVTAGATVVFWDGTWTLERELSGAGQITVQTGSGNYALNLQRGGSIGTLAFNNWGGALVLGDDLTIGALSADSDLQNDGAARQRKISASKAGGANLIIDASGTATARAINLDNSITLIKRGEGTQKLQDSQILGSLSLQAGTVEMLGTSSIASLVGVAGTLSVAADGALTITNASGTLTSLTLSDGASLSLQNWSNLSLGSLVASEAGNTITLGSLDTSGALFTLTGSSSSGVINLNLNNFVFRGAGSYTIFDGDIGGLTLNLVEGSYSVLAGYVLSYNNGVITITQAEVDDFWRTAEGGSSFTWASEAEGGWASSESGEENLNYLSGSNVHLSLSDTTEASRVTANIAAGGVTTGNVEVSAGYLTLNQANGNLTVNGNMTLDGTTLTVSGGAMIVAGTLTSTATSAIALESSATLRLGGLAGNGGSIAGSVTLAEGATVAGAWSISGESLTVVGSVLLENGATLTIMDLGSTNTNRSFAVANEGDMATIEWLGGHTNPTVSNLTLGQGIKLKYNNSYSSSSQTRWNTFSNLLLDGELELAAGEFCLSGTSRIGTITSTASNVQFTIMTGSAITLGGGTIDGVFQIRGNSTLMLGGDLTLTGGIARQGNLGGGESPNNTTSAIQSTTEGVNLYLQNSTNVEYHGSLSISGNLVKSNAGVQKIGLTLGAANTVALHVGGNVTVNGGGLEFGNSGHTGDFTIGGTLTLDANTSFSWLSLGALEVDGNVSLADGAALTIGGNMSMANLVASSGTSTLTFTPTENKGTVEISLGSITGDGNLSILASAATTGNAPKLTLSGGGSESAGFVGTGSLTIGSSAQGFDVVLSNSGNIALKKALTIYGTLDGTSSGTLYMWADGASLSLKGMAKDASDSTAGRTITAANASSNLYLGFTGGRTYSVELGGDWTLKGLKIDNGCTGNISFTSDASLVGDGAQNWGAVQLTISDDWTVDSGSSGRNINFTKDSTFASATVAFNGNVTFGNQKNSGETTAAKMSLGEGINLLVASSKTFTVDRCGELTLAGSNTVTGALVVSSGGKIIVNGAGSSFTSLVVGGSVELNAALTLNGTLGMSEGGFLKLGSGIESGWLTAGTNFAINGNALTLDVSALTLDDESDSYLLFSNWDAIKGSFANLSISFINFTEVSGYELVFDAVSGTIHLQAVASDPDTLYWVGTDGEWTTGEDDLDWAESAGGNGGYGFSDGKKVVFGSTTEQQSISLGADIAVGGMTVQGDYAFSLDGHSLTVGGEGLTIAAGSTMTLGDNTGGSISFSTGAVLNLDGTLVLKAVSDDRNAGLLWDSTISINAGDTATIVLDFSGALRGDARPTLASYIGSTYDKKIELKGAILAHGANGSTQQFSEIVVHDGAQLFLNGNYAGNVSISGMVCEATDGKNNDYHNQGHAQEGALRLNNGVTLSGNLTLNADAAVTIHSGSGTISGSVGSSTDGRYGLYAHGDGTLTLSGTVSGISGIYSRHYRDSEEQDHQKANNNGSNVTLSGTLDVGTSGQSFVFGVELENKNITLTSTSTLSGAAAITKTGEGALNLQGNMSGFTGSFTVEAGSVAFNATGIASLSALTVNDGSFTFGDSVSGSFSFGSLTLNGGSFALSSGITTLSIDTLTLGGSSLDMGTRTISVSSLVANGGAISLEKDGHISGLTSMSGSSLITLTLTGFVESDFANGNAYQIFTDATNFSMDWWDFLSITIAGMDTWDHEYSFQRNADGSISLVEITDVPDTLYWQSSNGIWANGAEDWTDENGENMYVFSGGKSVVFGANADATLESPELVTLGSDVSVVGITISGNYQFNTDYAITVGDGGLTIGADSSLTMGPGAGSVTFEAGAGITLDGTLVLMAVSDAGNAKILWDAIPTITAGENACIVLDFTEAIRTDRLNISSIFTGSGYDKRLELRGSIFEYASASQVFSVLEVSDGAQLQLGADYSGDVVIAGMGCTFGDANNTGSHGQEGALRLVGKTLSGSLTLSADAAVLVHSGQTGRITGEVTSSAGGRYGFYKHGEGSLNLEGSIHDIAGIYLRAYTDSTGLAHTGAGNGGTLNISGTLNVGTATQTFVFGVEHASKTITLQSGGTLTGAAAITKTGDGSLVLSGDITGFTGALTIAGGSVTLTNGGTISGLLTMNDGTTLTTGGNVTLSSGLAGSGTVNITSTAADALTLTISGDNTGKTHSGSVTIGSADHRIGLEINIASGANTTQDNNRRQTIGSLTLNGDLTLTSGWLFLNAGGTSVINGAISGNGILYLSGNHHLTINGNNGSLGTLNNLYFTGSGATVDLAGDVTIGKFHYDSATTNTNATINRASGVQDDILVTINAVDAFANKTTTFGEGVNVKFTIDLTGISGTLSFGGDLTGTNWGIDAGTVTVAGDASFSGSVTTSGTAASPGQFTIGGDLSIAQHFDIATGGSKKSIVSVGGDLTVGDNGTRSIWLGYGVGATSSLTVEGTFTASSEVAVHGDSTLTIGGYATFNGSLNFRTPNNNNGTAHSTITLKSGGSAASLLFSTNNIGTLILGGDFEVGSVSVAGTGHQINRLEGVSDTVYVVFNTGSGDLDVPVSKTVAEVGLSGVTLGEGVAIAKKGSHTLYLTDGGTIASNFRVMQGALQLSAATTFSGSLTIDAAGKVVMSSEGLLTMGSLIGGASEAAAGSIALGSLRTSGGWLDITGAGSSGYIALDLSGISLVEGDYDLFSSFSAELLANLHFSVSGYESARWTVEYVEESGQLQIRAIQDVPTEFVWEGRSDTLVWGGDQEDVDWEDTEHAWVNDADVIFRGAADTASEVTVTLGSDIIAGQMLVESGEYVFAGDHSLTLTSVLEVAEEGVATFGSGISLSLAQATVDGLLTIEGSLSTGTSGISMQGSGEVELSGGLRGAGDLQIAGPEVTLYAQNNIGFTGSINVVQGALIVNVTEGTTLASVSLSGANSSLTTNAALTITKLTMGDGSTATLSGDLAVGTFALNATGNHVTFRTAGDVPESDSITLSLSSAAAVSGYFTFGDRMNVTLGGSAAWTFSGDTTINGNLINNRAGNVAFSGAATINGNVTYTSGNQLQFSGNSSTTHYVYGQISQSGNGTIYVLNGARLVIAGSDGSAGHATKFGIGGNATGYVSLGGDFVIDFLQLDSDATNVVSFDLYDQAGATSVDLTIKDTTVNSGALLFSARANSFGKGVNVIFTRDITNITATQTYGGNLTGQAFGVSTGTVTVGTLGDDDTVSGGNLTLSGDLTMGASGTLTVYGSSSLQTVSMGGGTLSLGNGGSISTLSGTAGNLSINGGTLSITNASATLTNLTLGGTLQMGSNSGANQLTLSSLTLNAGAKLAIDSTGLDGDTALIAFTGGYTLSSKLTIDLAAWGLADLLVDEDQEYSYALFSGLTLGGADWKQYLEFINFSKENWSLVYDAASGCIKLSHSEREYQDSLVWNSTSDAVWSATDDTADWLNGTYEVTYGDEGAEDGEKNVAFTAGSVDGLITSITVDGTVNVQNMTVAGDFTFNKDATNGGSINVGGDLTVSSGVLTLGADVTVAGQFAAGDGAAITSGTDDEKNSYGVKLTGSTLTLAQGGTVAMLRYDGAESTVKLGGNFAIGRLKGDNSSNDVLHFNHVKSDAEISDSDLITVTINDGDRIPWTTLTFGKGVNANFVWTPDAWFQQGGSITTEENLQFNGTYGVGADDSAGSFTVGKDLIIAGDNSGFTVKNANSAVTVGRDFTLTGALTMNNGTVDVTRNFQSGGAVTVNSGSLSIGGTASFGGAVKVVGSASLTLKSAADVSMTALDTNADGATPSIILGGDLHLGSFKTHGGASTTFSRYASTTKVGNVTVTIDGFSGAAASSFTFGEGVDVHFTNSTETAFNTGTITINGSFTYDRSSGDDAFNFRMGASGSFIVNAVTGSDGAVQNSVALNDHVILGTDASSATFTVGDGVATSLASGKTLAVQNGATATFGGTLSAANATLVLSGTSSIELKNGGSIGTLTNGTATGNKGAVTVNSGTGGTLMVSGGILKISSTTATLTSLSLAGTLEMGSSNGANQLTLGGLTLSAGAALKPTSLSEHKSLIAFSDEGVTLAGTLAVDLTGMGLSSLLSNVYKTYTFALFSGVADWDAFESNLSITSLSDLGLSDDWTMEFQNGNLVFKNSESGDAWVWNGEGNSTWSDADSSDWTQSGSPQHHVVYFMDEEGGSEVEGGSEIDVDSNGVTVAGVVVTEGQYTFSGGTITASAEEQRLDPDDENNGKWVIGGDANNTADVILKTGTSGFESFELKENGTLTLGHEEALGSEGKIIFSGGVVAYGDGYEAGGEDLSSRFDDVGSHTGSASVVMGSSDQTWEHGNGVRVALTHGLSVSGDSTLTLNWTTALTETHLLRAAAGEAYEGDFDLDADVILTSDSAGLVLALSGDITGEGGLTLDGEGSYELSGDASAYEGTLTLKADVAISGDNALGGADTTLVLEGGDVSADDEALIQAGTVKVQKDTTLHGEIDLKGVLENGADANDPDYTSGALTAGEGSDITLSGSISGYTAAFNTGANAVLTLSSASGTVANAFAGSGTVVFANAVELTGNMSGSMGLRNDSTGTLTLAGDASKATGALSSANGGSFQLGTASAAGSWGGSSLSGGKLTLVNGELTAGANFVKGTGASIEAAVAAGKYVDVKGMDGGLLSKIAVSANGQLRSVSGNIQAGGQGGIEVNLVFGKTNASSSIGSSSPGEAGDYLITGSGTLRVEDAESFKLDFSNEAFVDILMAHRAANYETWLHIYGGGALEFADSFYGEDGKLRSDMLGIITESGSRAQLLSALGFNIADYANGDLGLVGSSMEVYLVTGDDASHDAEVNGWAEGLGGYKATVVNHDNTLDVYIDSEAEAADFGYTWDADAGSWSDNSGTTYSDADLLEEGYTQHQLDGRKADQMNGGRTVNNLVGLEGSELHAHNDHFGTDGVRENVVFDNSQASIGDTAGTPGDTRTQVNGQDTTFEGTIIGDEGVDFVKKGAGQLTVGSANGTGGIDAEGDFTLRNGSLLVQGTADNPDGMNHLGNLVFDYEDGAEAGGFHFSNGSVTKASSIVESKVGADGASVEITDEAELILDGDSALENTHITGDGSGSLVVSGHLSFTGDGSADDVIDEVNVTVTDGGSLSLSDGASISEGDITVTGAGSSLSVGDGSSLSTDGALTVEDGGLVDLGSSTGNSVGALQGDGVLSATGGELAVTGQGGVFSGTLTGADGVGGTLLVQEGADLTLDNVTTDRNRWNASVQSNGKLTVDVTDGTDVRMGDITLSGDAELNLVYDPQVGGALDGNLHVDRKPGQGKAKLVVDVQSAGNRANELDFGSLYFDGDMDDLDFALSGPGAQHYDGELKRRADNSLYVGVEKVQENLYLKPNMEKNVAAGAEILWNLTDPDSAAFAYAYGEGKGKDLYNLANSTALLTALFGQDMSRTFAAVAGSSIATLSSALDQDLQRQLNVIRNRSTMMSDSSSLSADKPSMHAWVNAESGYSKLKADSYAPGFTLNGWGGTVGLSVDVDEATSVGLALTAMYNDLKTSSADNGRGDLDTAWLSAFARTMSGNWSHTFVASVGLAEVKLNRTVDYTMGSYSTKGETDGFGLGFMYEVGYSIPMNEQASLVLQPIANVQFRYESISGYSETGSDAGLKVKDMERQTITFGMGARMQGVLSEDALGRVSFFETRMLVKVDAGDNRGLATNSLFYGAMAQEVESAAAGRTALELGAGLTLPVDNTSAFFIDASVEFRKGSSSMNASAGYRLSF